MTALYQNTNLWADYPELSAQDKNLERYQAWLMNQFDIATLIATPEPAHAAGVVQHILLDEPVLKGFLSTLEEAEFSNSAQACLRASDLPPGLSALYLWDGIPAPLKAALRPRDMDHLDILQEKLVEAGLRLGEDIGFDLERLTSISLPETPGGHIRLGIGAGWERFSKYAKKKRFSSLHMLQDVFETPFDACKRGVMGPAGRIAHGEYEVGAHFVAEPAARGFLDATWIFPDADRALRAFTKICNRIPPLFAEYIPQAHLAIAALSGFGRRARRRPPKIGKAGIRLVYRGTILKARLQLAKASFFAELAGGVMRHTGPHQSDAQRRNFILAAGAVEIAQEVTVALDRLEELISRQAKMFDTAARDNPIFMGAEPVLAPRIRVIRGAMPVMDHGVICPRNLKEPLVQWAEVAQCGREIAAGLVADETLDKPAYAHAMPSDAVE